MMLAMTASLGAQTTLNDWRGGALAAPVQNAQFAQMLPSVAGEDEMSLLAAYLFNRYMVAAVHTDAGQEENLSLSYVGVLDPLMKKSFPADKAHKIYLKNQERVQETLSLMFRLARRSYPRNTRQEVKWAEALQHAAQQTRSRSPIAYAMPDKLFVQGDYVWADISFLVPALRMATVESENKVVLFEKKQATLEDFDNRLVSGGRNKPDYTYRWVKDECEYSSYVLGKHLLQTAAGEPERWQKTRLYKMTARPPKEAYYLRPAQGERFLLPDGTQAAKWQYHTALLLVLHTQKGDYIPIVLDAFLGDTETPFTLAQWLDFFDKTTQFEVTAFEQNDKIDEALQLPKEISPDGQIIRVNGHDYKPAPIEE